MKTYKYLSRNKGGWFEKNRSLKTVVKKTLTNRGIENDSGIY